MRVVITGGTGSIGRRLVAALVARGDLVAVVSRRPRDVRRSIGGDAGRAVEVIAGDCQVPGPWQRAIDGADAVVHLAGAGIADRRWSQSYRDLIERSRVESTHQVVNAIEEAAMRPPTLITASGTGYYGETGDEIATERFPAGKGFLADLCVRWEEEARRAETLGVRVVRARIGVVLDEEGPALRRMLPWFRAGLGAILGGDQFLPWIHHADCVAGFLHMLDHRELIGPVNLTAPEPCRQRVFAKALGNAAGRPVFLRVPRSLARLAFGGVADELYRSQRVVPRALLDSGMRFEAEEITRAFELLLEEEAERERARQIAAGSLPRGPRPAPGERPRAALPRPTRPSVRPRLLIVSAEAAIADDDGRPRAGVREAVRAASSHGCAVVVATERSSASSSWLLADPLLHPISIVANGAVLWNEREGASPYLERLEQATLAAVLLAVRRAVPEITIFFEGDRWLASDAERQPDPSSGLGTLTLRLGANETPPKPVARMHIVGTPESVARARAAIEGPFWRERKIAMFARGATRLVIAAPLVDRAVAAQRIARLLGARREEVMAVVGVLDDLGLADWAGFSVATADAPESLRRLASATLTAGDDSSNPLANPLANPLMASVDRFLAR